MPLYATDARLVATYPLGPIVEGAAVNITVLSYAGSVDIGLTTCPTAVPRPAEVARTFERAVAELHALATGSFDDVDHACSPIQARSRNTESPADPIT
jgi:hypothetical protein